MRCFSLPVLCMLLSGVPTVNADEALWNQFMGPSGNGRIEVDKLFEESSAFSLELGWRQPLGSGYSDIIVDGTQLFTMFSDATDDYLVALSTDSGETLWRYKIGPTYKGHGGSVDGPTSTPLCDDGQVFGLGPHGDFFALDQRSGKQIWRFNLVETQGAKSPPWGFTSSPIMAAGHVVIEVGGEQGNSFCAFNVETGEQIWCSGTGTVFYQSPILIELAGVEQILCNTNSHVMGLDPTDGKILWTQLTSDKEFSAIARAQRLNSNRFLLSRSGYYGDFAAYDIQQTEQAWHITEALVYADFKNTYQGPLVYQDHLYGINGRILVCVAMDSGERVWRSREPGIGRMILVNDRLVTWGADGDLYVGRASPSGYETEAQIHALDTGGFNMPACDGKRFYVRNYLEIAAINVVASASLKASTVDLPSLTANSEFGKFVRQLSGAEDKKSQIADFFEKHPTMPLLEGDRLVHFIYQTEATDLVMASDLAPRGASMFNVPGSDFHYRSYTVEPNARLEYRFIEDFEKPQSDPRNKKIVIGSKGSFSELVMPKWEEAAYLMDHDATDAGVLDVITIESQLTGTRTLSVYLPSGYGKGEQSYPLLVVCNGDQALEFGLMGQALDSQMPDPVAAAVVVFVAFNKGQFGIYGESAGKQRGDYIDMLGKELIPFLEQRYRLISARDARAITGTGAGAYASMMTALQYSNSFARVASQGIDLHIHLRRDLLRAATENLALDIYMEWSGYEQGSPEQDYFYQRDHAELVTALQEAGHRVAARKVPAGSTWGTWRAQSHHVLAALLSKTDDK